MKKQLMKEIMELINLVPQMKEIGGRCCPHCESQHIVKNGRSSGKQRYICKDCGTTFNDYTNTILSMTHYPEKWPLFIECTLKGYSLRKSEEETKVAYVTLFYWRHKLLTALKQIKNEKMGHVVELSDIYMGYSEKGNKHIHDREARKHGSGYSPFNLYMDKVCVLIAKDRNSKVALKAFFDKRITRKNLIELLDGLMDQNTILCTNNRPVYVQFARYEKIKHYRIQNSVYHLLGNYNIEGAKKYANDLKKWLLKFRGVASKYLNNYIFCYKFLSSININETIEEVKEMLQAAIRQKVSETYTSVSSVKCAW